MKKLLLIAGVIFSAYAMDTPQGINDLKAMNGQSRAPQNRVNSYQSLLERKERIQDELGRARRDACLADFCFWCVPITAVIVGVGIRSYIGHEHQE